MGNSKLIEINGRMYDASSGRLMKSQSNTVAVTVSRRSERTQRVSIDGFAINKKAATQPVANVQRDTKPLEVHHVPKASLHPAHSKHKKLQRSKTLMRQGIKKPAGNKLHAVSHIQTQHTTRSIHTAAVPLLVTPKDAARAARAQNSKQHHTIKKFSQAAVSYMPVKTTDADIKPMAEAPHTVPAVAPAPQPTPPLMPSIVASASHGVLDRMLDQALQDADSHKQRPYAKKRGRKVPKFAAIGTAFAAIVLLAGFFAYQNIPNVAMRVAATRTGIDATVPRYSPSGFSFNGPIAINQGVITLRFSANADSGRNFAISQRSSDWDSKSLLENFVIANGYSYQTFQDKGNTIYVYDNDRATWVSKGIWFTIEGNAKLNSEQLLKIASSM